MAGYDDYDGAEIGTDFSVKESAQPGYYFDHEVGGIIVNECINEHDYKNPGEVKIYSGEDYFGKTINLKYKKTIPQSEIMKRVMKKTKFKYVKKFTAKGFNGGKDGEEYF